MLLTLGLSLVLASDSGLARAAEQLAAFEYGAAIETLETLKRSGGRDLADNTRLHELLGIAYASSGRIQDAEEAFFTLATIAPQHAIHYTLSPKVTFAFERARERAMTSGSPELQLVWPAAADVNTAVPIDVEVIANPLELMRDGVLVAERDGVLARYPFVLAPRGVRQSIVVAPPPAPREEGGVLRLHVLALDKDGNQVAQVGSQTQPRQVALTYTAPRRWYQRPWVWAVTGVALAAITAGTVYLLADDPPERLPLSVDIR